MEEEVSRRLAKKMLDFCRTVCYYIPAFETVVSSATRNAERLCILDGPLSA